MDTPIELKGMKAPYDDADLIRYGDYRAKLARGDAPVNPTMSHEQLVAAAESIGMRKPSTGQSMKQLISTMQQDRGYAWSWQCNIAMAILDSGGCTHRQANLAAARVMQRVFDVDVTNFPEMLHFQTEWERQPAPIFKQSDRGGA